MAPTGQGLERRLGRGHFFALGFGSIIGSAWIVMLGDWLAQAGPGGAAAGFLLGALAMGFTALAYAELASRWPEAGGEFALTLRAHGPAAGYYVGWVLAFYLIGVCVFEAVALAWLLEKIWFQLRGPDLYALFGETVSAGAIVIGVSATLAISWANVHGAASAGFQKVATFAFLGGCVMLVSMGGLLGSSSNLDPLLAGRGNSPWWQGALWIFATCAFWLNGFQTALQGIEERAPGISPADVGRMVFLSVFVAALFYILIIFSSAMAAPWQELSGQAMAPAIAMQRILGPTAATAILGLAALSVIKTWNAVAMAASRTLFALGRQGMLASSLGAVHPRYGTPARAALVVGAVTGIGLFLGRGAIVPLVNMASMCLSAGFLLFTLTVVQARRKQGPAAFTLPGGRAGALAAILLSALMSGVAFIEPWTREDRTFIPVEYVLLTAWLLIGYLLRRRQRPASAMA